MVATKYYNEELSAQLGLLHDIQWLFSRGKMEQFIGMKTTLIETLPLNFLVLCMSRLLKDHNVKKGISFYLQGKFFELNLNALMKSFLSTELGCVIVISPL